MEHRVELGSGQRPHIGPQRDETREIGHHAGTVVCCSMISLSQTQ